MRCGSRVLKTGDGKSWPDIGCQPVQQLCLAAFSRKAGVIADASQGELHYEGDTTGATSRVAPTPIQRSETSGAGNDCDAFSLPRWEQGKEPIEHDQLTPAGAGRQALSGAFVWRRKLPLMRIYLPVRTQRTAACGLDGCKSCLWSRLRTGRRRLPLTSEFLV